MNRRKLLILVTFLVLLNLIFRDSEILKILYAKDLSKISEEVLVKIRNYCFVLGALLATWGSILENYLGPKPLSTSKKEINI